MEEGSHAHLANNFQAVNREGTRRRAEQLAAVDRLVHAGIRNGSSPGSRSRSSSRDQGDKKRSLQKKKRSSRAKGTGRRPQRLPPNDGTRLRRRTLEERPSTSNGRFGQGFSGLQRARSAGGSSTAVVEGSRARGQDNLATRRAIPMRNFLAATSPAKLDGANVPQNRQVVYGQRQRPLTSAADVRPSPSRVKGAGAQSQSKGQDETYILEQLHRVSRTRQKDVSFSGGRRGLRSTVTARGTGQRVQASRRGDGTRLLVNEEKPEALTRKLASSPGFKAKLYHDIQSAASPSGRH